MLAKDLRWQVVMSTLFKKYVNAYEIFNVQKTRGKNLETFRKIQNYLFVFMSSVIVVKVNKKILNFDIGIYGTKCSTQIRGRSIKSKVFFRISNFGMLFRPMTHYACF